MISTPDRIGDVIAALERGEQVDWAKVGDLQALDLARVGRQFMEQAVAHDAAMTAEIEQQVKATA